MNKKIEKLIEETKQNIKKIDEQIDGCLESIEFEKTHFYDDNCDSDNKMVSDRIEEIEKELHKLKKQKEFYEDYLKNKGV